MKFILVLAAAVMLLSGCIGVPQEKYDSLKSSCDAQQADAAVALAAEKAKTAQVNSKLSDCTAAKQALESLLASGSAECNALKNDSVVLAAIREKTALIAKYESAVQYYNDCYGPGQIPNTYKYNRMDVHLLSFDRNLYSLWGGVKGCDGVVACDAAKLKFLSSINASISSLSLQAVQLAK